MSVETVDLPSREDVELADYKIGTFSSDLDLIRSELERCAGDTITVEEYLRRVNAGEELPSPPEYDPAELARLVLFATDVLADIETIRADAEAIQDTARHLFHEQAYDARAHRRLVRGWHEAELAAKNGGED